MSSGEGRVAHGVLPLPVATTLAAHSGSLAWLVVSRRCRPRGGMAVVALRALRPPAGMSRFVHSEHPRVRQRTWPRSPLALVSPARPSPEQGTAGLGEGVGPTHKVVALAQPTPGRTERARGGAVGGFDLPHIEPVSVRHRVPAVVFSPRSRRDGRAKRELLAQPWGVRVRAHVHGAYTCGRIWRHQAGASCRSANAPTQAQRRRRIHPRSQHSEHCASPRDAGHRAQVAVACEGSRSSTKRQAVSSLVGGRGRGDCAELGQKNALRRPCGRSFQCQASDFACVWALCVPRRPLPPQAERSIDGGALQVRGGAQVRANGHPKTCRGGAAPTGGGRGASQLAPEAASADGTPRAARACT